MTVSMDLLNHLKNELEQEKRKSEKFRQILEKIANGYDDKATPKPRVLEKEDMASLAIQVLSATK